MLQGRKKTLIKQQKRRVSSIQEMVPVEQGCVFLTSLKVEAGEKRAERGEFMLMEWFKRERARVKKKEM